VRTFLAKLVAVDDESKAIPHGDTNARCTRLMPGHGAYNDKTDAPRPGRYLERGRRAHVLGGVGHGRRDRSVCRRAGADCDRRRMAVAPGLASWAWIHAGGVTA